MKRLALALLSALALAAPSHAGATCAAPQPEHAHLVTPPLAEMPPGAGFVLRGSEAVSEAVTLTGPATLTLTGTEIAPHVLRFVLPQSLAPGRYDIASTYRGGAPASVGGVEVTPAAPAMPAPTTAPTGRLTHTTSPGRWSPSHSVSLTLTTAAPTGIAVVFDWTMPGGGHFGSIAWVNADSREAELGGSGHCGGYPYGATLPTRGTTVRVAFIDERGQMGPWGSLTVR
jgi:hypothetical protein